MNTPQPTPPPLTPEQIAEEISLKPVVESAMSISERIVYGWLTGEVDISPSAWADLRESIATALQAERDRASALQKRLDDGKCLIEKAAEVIGEVAELRNRAEKAERELAEALLNLADATSDNSLSIEGTRAWLKAELAEARRLLEPFADKGRLIAGNNTATVQWRDCRAAADFLSCHQPKREETLTSVL